MKTKGNIHFEIPISLGISTGGSDHLLQETRVLPTQFFHDPSAEQPEKRLMEAVLVDALDRFEKGKDKKASAHARHLALEAKQWFFSLNEDWPFSFIPICHVLNFDPESIKKCLLSEDWHYEKPRGDVTRSERLYITPLTPAQRMGRKLAKETVLRSMLHKEPLRIAQILRVVRKNDGWREVYNLVFGFLFFYLSEPPQTATQVAHHLKCGQAYANNKVRDQFCQAINSREPLFEDALHQIATKCDMDIRLLGMLLSRIRN